MITQSALMGARFLTTASVVLPRFSPRARVDITFQVMGIRKPIISVARLVTNGWTVCFGPQAFLCKKNSRVALLVVGGMYYLTVRMVSPTENTNEPEVPDTSSKAIQTLQLRAEVCVLQPAMRRWVEFLADADSPLSTWFQQAGQQSCNLPLDQLDLADPQVVQKIGDRLRECLEQGWLVFFWLSLASSAWSRWNTVDAERSIPTRQKIRLQKLAACQVLANLASMLVPLMDHFPQQLLVAQVWPTTSQGWRATELGSLLARLPVCCRFDTCCYGMKSLVGKPIKADWTVRANFPEIAEP